MSQLLTIREQRAGATRAGENPEKVRPWHRDRLAVVYVRQSTPQQVLIHQESTRLQYGLAERARALGWALHAARCLGTGARERNAPIAETAV